MKRLLLVRHAKSDWSDGSVEDFDRPLNDRGRMDAPEMATYLASRGVLPSLLVSSPAHRAYTTARLFAEIFGIPENDISKEETLYEASADTILAAVRNFSDAEETVALFSHNPGLTMAAGRFAQDYLDNVPTCGVALIEADITSWRDFQPEVGTMRELLVPREVLSRYHG